MKIPHQFSHYIFGVLQSGVTCAVASGITVFGAANSENKFFDWLIAWSMSWITMLPVIFLIAPILRQTVEQITDK
jgi:hypothetical protein